MLIAGTETGSLINHVMSNVAAPTPTKGMGATILRWTDRKAATIIKVTPKTVTVRYDTVKRTDANGMSESQTYEYAPNPAGVIEVFRMTKRGWRNASGNGLGIGYRAEYYDFSF